MRLILAAAAVAFSLPAAAESLDIPSGTYALDRTHAALTWKVNHLGFSTYTGMFDKKGLDATIELDADNVANSALTATVDGLAVETLHPREFDPRNIAFNDEIESEMFLNTVAFPEITFKSTGIEITGANTANIEGELTLNNQTHPFVLETTLNRAAEHPMLGTPALGISATGTFDRTQYGIDALAGPVSADVTIEIQGEFILQQ